MAKVSTSPRITFKIDKSALPAESLREGDGATKRRPNTGAVRRDEAIIADALDDLDDYLEQREHVARFTLSKRF